MLLDVWTAIKCTVTDIDGIKWLHYSTGLAESIRGAL